MSGASRRQNTHWPGGQRLQLGAKLEGEDKSRLQELLFPGLFLFLNRD